MAFILISGYPNRGKTHVCNRLHDRIVADQSFTVLNAPSNVSIVDFIAHYEKGGKCIVLNSPSDDDRRMGNFAKYLDDLAQKGVCPDVIITTIRETNNGGYLMSRMLELLEAFANGVPNLLNYYIQNIASSTSFMPRTLSRHAFVLHLEEQSVNGRKEKKEDALAPYWDDSADKVKAMIDLALKCL